MLLSLSHLGDIFTANVAKAHLAQEKEADETYQKRKASTCCHLRRREEPFGSVLTTPDNTSYPTDPLLKGTARFEDYDLSGEEVLVGAPMHSV